MTIMSVLPVRSAQRALGAPARADLERFHRKLERELVQAERSSHLHTRREARRQGAGAPADALRAIANHAVACEQRLDELLGDSIPVTAQLARIIAHTFSGVRYAFLDRLIAHERSYRATLLGLRHGFEVATLLFAVSDRGGMTGMRKFLGQMIPERGALLGDAVHALTWFADHPRRALAHD